VGKKEVEWKEVEWKEVEWKEVNKIKVVVAEVRAGQHVEPCDFNRAIAHLNGTTSWAKRYAVKGTKRAKRMQLSHPGLPAGTLAAILSGATRRLDCGGIELMT
jgi:hypothetical protein